MQERKGLSGLDVGHDVVIHGLHGAINDEMDLDKKSLRDRVQKTVVDRNNRSSRMPMEGGEGTNLVAHEGSLVKDEAQRAESL